MLALEIMLVALHTHSLSFICPDVLLLHLSRLMSYGVPLASVLAPLLQRWIC